MKRPASDRKGMADIGDIFPGEPFVWCGRKGAVIERGTSIRAILTGPVQAVWLAPNTKVERISDAPRLFFRNAAHRKGAEVVVHVFHAPRRGPVE